MNRRAIILGSIFAGVALPQAAKQNSTTAKQRVTEAERGFAATMAKRDYAAFSAYVSEEAVFFGGPDGRQVLRGKRAVIAAWKPYFEGSAAPFSWEPDSVEPLDSGTLALSSGPVRDEKGDSTARFTSIWRLEPDGKWRIIFDKGCTQCRCNA